MLSEASDSGWPEMANLLSLFEEVSFTLEIILEFVKCIQNTPIVLTLLYLALKDFTIIVICVFFIIYGNVSHPLPEILGLPTGEIWNPI